MQKKQWKVLRHFTGFWQSLGYILIIITSPHTNSFWQKSSNDLFLYTNIISLKEVNGIASSFLVCNDEVNNVNTHSVSVFTQVLSLAL